MLEEFSVVANEARPGNVWKLLQSRQQMISDMSMSLYSSASIAETPDVSGSLFFLQETETIFNEVKKAASYSFNATSGMEECHKQSKNKVALRQFVHLHE